MVDEMEIPIDIHYSKLLEWLLSRRHCNKDWQKNVMIIREKISAAIQDMPEDERIVELLQGSYINYFHCIRIVDILKDTEKSTKNFLGYYSSQRMNDWMEIKKMYEKKNIHLAEAAQILQRIIQYEIPALRKQISKSDQIITDCMKKEKDYAKQIIDSKKQYEKELLKLGIEGVNLRQEIVSLLADFPSFLDEITRSISSLNGPLHYYEQFQTYLYQNGRLNVLLPLCRLLMEKGAKVTVYEWKNNAKPAHIELPPLDAWTNEKNNADDEIDFGDDIIVPDDEIDFGDGKFQIEVIGDEKSMLIPDDEIDFGNGKFQIEVIGDEKNNINDGIARGLDALTVLENPQTRTLIYFELKELEKFLVMRKKDETLESMSDIYISGMEERPAALRKITIEKIDRWLMHVNEIINKLTDSQKVHLFRIRSSPQYVEKLVKILEQKRSLEERYKKMTALMIDKQGEMRINMQKARETLDGICKTSKVLQKEIEEEISKIYKGRKVNIMGGINAAMLT